MRGHAPLQGDTECLKTGTPTPLGAGGDALPQGQHSHCMEVIKDSASRNLPCRVIEVHGFFGFVVGSHTEWNDFHRGQAWGHAQDLASMSGFIQVFLGLRVGHACRVPAHDVEIDPCNHPGPTVPLDLENITQGRCWSLLLRSGVPVYRYAFILL